jgi:hypothetical protein
MAHTACLIGTDSGRSKKKKNDLGIFGASSRHVTKLEQSIFFGYLWVGAIS